MYGVAALVLTLFLLTSLSNCREIDSKEEQEADKKCFNKVMQDQEMQDQVVKDPDVKQNFRMSCRGYRRDFFLNPMEAAKKVIELYTQGLGGVD